jgi:hypothetical protein
VGDFFEQFFVILTEEVSVSSSVMFHFDYLARNEPDKILCRAVTFCQKVKWWTLEQYMKILKQVQDDGDKIASCLAMTDALDSCLRRNDRNKKIPSEFRGDFLTDTSPHIYTHRWRDRSSSPCG